MKKLPLFLLLVLSFCSLPVYADIYLEPAPYDHVYQSSSQTGWLAADTVELEQSHWAVGDAASVYAELVSHFGTAQGVPSQGIDWYFNQHWPTFDVNTYLGAWNAVDPLTIQEGVISHDGMVLTLWSGNSGHAVGLYGEDVSGGTITGLYVEDSAIMSGALQHWTITQSGWYGGSYFWYLDTLEPNPQPTGTPVPEPGVLWLLGMGVATLGLVRGQTRFWRSPAA